MNFKIDTREKFTMITPESDFSADNFTEDFKHLIHSCLQHKTNTVVSLKNVIIIKESLLQEIAALQNEFYTQNVSFVICEIQPQVLAAINKLELNDVLNTTPSASEAWDIVQMEEVERELLGNE